jgi:branched-chain amino acid transport system permease protein
MNVRSILTSIDERYHNSRALRWLVVGLLIAYGAILPFTLADYLINLLINTAIFALIATAFNFAFGFAAVPSFGHAAFYALGGYSLVLLLSNSEAVPLVSDGIVVPILLTIAIAAVAAVIMGLIALRGIGLYFALLTFGIAELFHQMLLRLDFTGGSNGLLLFLPELPFGIVVTPLLIYYLAYGTLVATMGIFYWILQSRFGRAMRAIRANDERAKFVGYPTNRIKLITFVISAVFTTFGGIYLTLYNRFVGPSVAAADVSLELLFVTVIGGPSYLLGPALGAVFLSITEFLSGDLGNLSRVVVGAVFIIVILYAPGGLYGKLVDLWNWLTE